MKFPNSIEQTMQSAAAPVHQDVLQPTLPNRAARRAKSVNHRETNEPATPFQPPSFQARVANGDGVQVIDRVLRLPEVLAMVGIGRTLLLAMTKNGEFPPPLKLTARLRGWKLSAVQAFLASKEVE
jgi:predicted DNA-binding transcriptional regulator AlpA